MTSVNTVHRFILFVYTLRLSFSLDHRQEEYKRILKHELLYINSSQIGTSNFIEFSAFNQHYKVQLEENPHINAAKIRHTSVDTDSFPISLKSCHYLGNVLSTNDSVVALSMCANRGIRARIDAFGEVLIIKPAKYYLDPDFDSTHSHEITDQHLAYRLSDFNKTHVHSNTEDDIVPVNNDNKRVKRRRLVYNSGEQYVETLVMVGPFRIARYKSIYPGSWYSEIVSDHSDIMNTAASIYLSTSWGSDVGQIYLVLVEIELVSAFSGDYASLYPSVVSSSCTNIETCEIDDEDFLSKIRSYISTSKTWSGDFDNVMMFHHMDLKQNTIGVAYRPGICTVDSVGHIYVTNDGLDSATMTFVHELGHNFGIQHDQEYDCNNGHLMDATANDGRTFSSCSINALKTWFASEPNSCLQKPASLPSGDADDIESNYYMTCIEMKGHSTSDLNGEYDEFGEYNGLPYYTHKGNSYTVKYSSKWCIYSKSGTQESCCEQENIEDCNGMNQAYTYIGCYNDKSDRSLPYGPLSYGYDADSCSSACQGYTYFALQNGGWCCCGNDWDKASQYGSSSGCPSTKLGGGWLNDVFRNNLAYTYKGCYKDTSTRALPYGPGTRGYTVSTCSATCQSYKYFGLQYNGECWCGNDWSRATQYGTSTSCPSSQMGGSWCNNVFENVAGDTGSGTWSGSSSAYIDTCVEDTTPDARMCGDTSYACFSITGLRPYIAGNAAISFNGIWRARSDCYNGENTYELVSPNQVTMYMWRYKPWRWWKRTWYIEGDIGDGVIGGWLPQLSGDQALAFCKEYDIIASCSGNIEVLVEQKSVGWDYTKDSAGKVSMSCDSAAFEMADDCFINNVYGDALCVFDNNILWNGSVQFELWQLCSNEEVVYFYANEESSLNETFYLHFDVYYPYIASNESVVRWIVTVNELTSDPETWCEEESLTDCTQGNWIFERQVDDSVSNIYDEAFKVNTGRCRIHDSETQSKKTLDAKVVILVVLMTVVVLMLIGIGLWCCFISKKMRKHVKHEETDETDESVDYNLMEA